MNTAYITIVVILCFSILYLNTREVLQSKLSESKTDRRYLLATQIVLFIGVFLRIVFLDYPYGINPDEAIAGYDAWCLANYGVDQHLYSYPVYLKSWGSGQSALYAYLSAPLIKLFGLSLLIHRLPMAIISSISLICFYFALKKSGAKSLFIFICVLIFAFNPWHFTKSRWALDCNLAPDLLLIATSLIIIAYYASKERIRTCYYIVGFVFIGLTAYGYGVSWLMLPFYTIGVLAVLYKKKAINIRQIITVLSVTLVVIAPLLLFAFQLTTGGDAMSIGPISIPQLNENRYDTTSPFMMDWGELSAYLTNVGKSLITGYDSYLANSFPYTGQFYNAIGWILILIAFIVLIKKKDLNLFYTLFLIWLLACIPVTLFVLYNVNRWNMIWIPLVYFFVRGSYFCISKKIVYQVIFYLVFVLLTSMFAFNYRYLHYVGFSQDIEEVITIAAREEIETVYVTEQIKFAEILFYDPLPPAIFNETREAVNPDEDFVFYKKFGKYNMGNDFSVFPKEKTAYIISSYYLDSIDKEKFKVFEGERFSILWND